MKNKKGFTLVELLAVIVVLAIVMLVVADRVGDAMLKSRGNALALQVKSLNREVEKVGATDNQITTKQINKIVSSGDLTYLGYMKAGTNNFDNDVIVVQAKKGSKFSNISFTKDIEDLGTLVESYNNNNFVSGDNNLKNKKEWLREPIIYFETTVPVSEVYAVGEEVCLNGKEDCFNVIKDNGNSVVLLAKYNLTLDGLKQDTIEHDVAFSEKNINKKPNENFGYWTDDSGALLKEYGDSYPANVYSKKFINSSNSYDCHVIVNIVENYVAKLKNIKHILKEDETMITGRLIYVSELLELGYPSKGFGDCTNKENEKWLINGQDWWTGSADSFLDISYVWRSGYLGSRNPWHSFVSVRPVIEINKSLLK